MVRRFVLVALVFCIGLTLGRLARERPTPAASAAPLVEQPAPVTEISVSRPDAEPVRLRVVASGNEREAVGVQEPWEWSLCLWFGTDTPRRCQRYRCEPK